MTQETIGQIGALISIASTILFIYAIGDFFLRRRKQEEVSPATPVTEDGLAKFDDLSPGEAVMMAWTEDDNNPAWRLMQDNVRVQMPVLARALDRMVEN